jgi:hypothetical protein
MAVRGSRLGLLFTIGGRLSHRHPAVVAALATESDQR